MDLTMWELVYVGLILAMVVPMIGVALGFRYYRCKDISQGKACVIIGVVLGLIFAAVSVHFVTVLLETTGTTTILVWFGIFGYLLVLDIVYIRMMFSTKWAKRMMGTCKEKPASEQKPKKVMTVDDIGKNWEKRIQKRPGPEEE
jgi:hypothetical protein